MRFRSYPIATAINHSDALEEIQRILSGRRWGPDTLEAIAEVLRAAGYEIEDTSVPSGPDAGE